MKTMRKQNNRKYGKNGTRKIGGGVWDNPVINSATNWLLPESSEVPTSVPPVAPPATTTPIQAPAVPPAVALSRSPPPPPSSAVALSSASAVAPPPPPPPSAPAAGKKAAEKKAAEKKAADAATKVKNDKEHADQQKAAKEKAAKDAAEEKAAEEKAAEEKAAEEKAAKDAAKQKALEKEAVAKEALENEALEEAADKAAKDATDLYEAIQLPLADMVNSALNEAKAKEKERRDKFAYQWPELYKHLPAIPLDKSNDIIQIRRYLNNNNITDITLTTLDVIVKKDLDVGYVYLPFGIFDMKVKKDEKINAKIVYSKIRNFNYIYTSVNAMISDGTMKVQDIETILSNPKDEDLDTWINRKVKS